MYTIAMYVFNNQYTVRYYEDEQSDPQTLYLDGEEKSRWTPDAWDIVFRNLQIDKGGRCYRLIQYSENELPLPAWLCGEESWTIGALSRFRLCAETEFQHWFWNGEAGQWVINGDSLPAGPKGKWKEAFPGSGSHDTVYVQTFPELRVPAYTNGAVSPAPNEKSAFQRFLEELAGYKEKQG